MHGREGGLSSWRFHFLRLPEMHAARLAALRGLSTEETGNCASRGRPPCTRLGLVRKIKAARILGRKTFITGRLRLGSQGQEMGEFRSHRDAPPRFWLLAALMWATRGGRLGLLAVSCLPPARAVGAFPQPHTGPVSEPSTGSSRKDPRLLDLQLL